MFVDGNYVIHSVASTIGSIAYINAPNLAALQQIAQQKHVKQSPYSTMTQVSTTSQYTYPITCISTHLVYAVTCM